MKPFLLLFDGDIEMIKKRQATERATSNVIGKRGPMNWQHQAKERAVALSEYFINNPSTPKAIMKLLRDDRHPLSVQRAQKVLRWLKDSQLVLKWQKILVPHMQTPLLKKLRQHPTSWIDLPLVDRELATRQKTIHTDI